MVKLYYSQGTQPGNEGQFKSRNEEIRMEMKKWEMKKKWRFHLFQGSLERQLIHVQLCHHTNIVPLALPVNYDCICSVPQHLKHCGHMYNLLQYWLSIVSIELLHNWP